MAVITVPASLAFDAVKLTLKRATAELRSPFTGRRQILSHPFAVWEFDGSTIKYDAADAPAIRAFLVALRGRANTFRLPIPGAALPASGYASNGLVNGGSQTGTSLVTDGWSNSTLILKAGDYFNIGDELKTCLADVTSNGSGQATITFEPNLRASPADNSVVKVVDPFVYLSLDGDDGASWDVSAPVTHSFKVKGVEAF